MLVSEVITDLTEEGSLRSNMRCFALTMRFVLCGGVCQLSYETIKFKQKKIDEMISVESSFL